MGGLLIDNSNSIIFIFLGHINAANPLFTEKKVLIFLYNQFNVSPIKKCNLQLFTDSINLVEVVNKNRAGLFHVNSNFEDEIWLELANDACQGGFCFREELKDVLERS